MPIKRIEYVPMPYAEHRITPDTSRLAALYAHQGDVLAALDLRRGENTAQTFGTLAGLFSNYQNGKREDRMADRALATRATEREQDLAERRAEREERDAERRAVIQEHEQAQRDKEAAAAAKAGADTAEDVQYGPMSETQMESVLHGPAAGRARYVFGPGTADGPELLPTKPQERAIQAEADIRKMGGTIAPGGQVIMPPKPAPLRLQAAMVNGTRTFVKVDDKGNTFDFADRPVQAAPIPPAARSSVDGGGAVAMTPEAIDIAAHRARLYGPSSIPTRFGDDDKKLILNREAAIAKAMGNSPAAEAMRAAAQKADQGALNQISKMAASAQAFESKALQQADLVDSLSAKVGRTDYPIINKWLVDGKVALGDTDAHLLGNALLTFTTEYSKIMEGATGSAAGASVSGQQTARELISKALSKGTLSATLAQMKKEMAMTNTGYRVTRDEIESRMGGGPAPASAGGGFIEAIDDKGNIHHAPAGTPLPPGWKLKQ